MGDPTDQAMAEMCARIRAAGGTLTVWAVLNEDRYETRFGDGYYLHVRGITLNEADAHRLAALGGPASEFVAWHVRAVRLGLEGNVAVFFDRRLVGDEFTIGQFAEILAEIAPGGSASRLLTGDGWQGRKPGPHLRELGSC